MFGKRERKEVGQGKRVRERGHRERERGKEKDFNEVAHADVWLVHPKIVGRISGVLSQIRVNVFPLVYFCFVFCVSRILFINYC